MFTHVDDVCSWHADSGVATTRAASRSERENIGVNLQQQGSHLSHSYTCSISAIPASPECGWTARERVEGLSEHRFETQTYS